MRIFMNETTGEYPRFIADIAFLHSGWVETDPLPEGWVDVEANDPPEEWKSHWVELAPVKIDGQWKRAFEYVEPKVI